MKIQILSGLSLALLSLSSGLQAQSSQLQGELQFIRGLVRDLRFFELAEHETENLKKTYKGSDDFKLVAQLAIEVSLEGAKRHPERERQRVLYKEAIDKSGAFIERYDGQPVVADARATMVQAIAEYGQFLNEEIEIAREEAPEKVQGLEEEAAKVFRQGVAAANSVMTHLRNKNKTNTIQYYLAWMRKGVMQRENGRAVKKDRGALCDQAKETLEELILEVGEDTALGQRALFEMAQVDEVLGDPKAAASAYFDTTVQILEALGNDQLELPESVQRLMFNMLQEIYERLAATRYEMGQSGEVTKLMEKYRKDLKEFDAEPHPRFGDLLFLTEARVMAESGDSAKVSKAMATAKAINKRHPADYVGLRAKKLIDAILSRSSDLVTGEALLEVARGFYQEKDYDTAILRFKNALLRMTDEEKKKLGLQTWDLLGRAHTQLGRNLEAALCHKTALENYGADAEKDVTKSVARRMSNALTRANRDAKDDTVFADLKQEIDSLEGQYNTGKAAAREYSAAQKAYVKRDFAKAAQLFGAVKPAFERFEMAKAYRIDCLIRQNKFDEARAAVADYRKWLTTKAAELEKDSVKNGYRAQAIDNIDLAEGRILYYQATPSSANNKKPDLAKVPEAIKALLAWEQKHKADSKAVHSMLGELYLAGGNEDSAMERYAKLQAIGGDAHSRLGYLIFDYYRDQMTATETALNAVTDKEGPNLESAKSKLKANRQQVLKFASEYTGSLGSPAYTVLFAAMQTAEELRKWKASAGFAEKILKLYENDKRWGKHPTFIKVKPALGLALLQQNKVQRANDMLVAARKALVDKKKQNTASYYELTRMIALARGGWPELDESGNYAPVLGLDKPIEAYKEYYANKKINHYFSKRDIERYTLPWYRFYLESFYLANRAAKKDTKYASYADSLFNIARSTDDFESLKKLGQRGKDMHYLFQSVRN